MRHLILLSAFFLVLAGCDDSSRAKLPPKPSIETAEPKTSGFNLAPSDAKMNQVAPESFQVECETSKGAFTISVTRSWSPRGADRFYNLAKNGYYDDTYFFRIVRDFVAQIGLHGNPVVNRKWRDAKILDDPVKKSNLRGYVTFAMSGPNTRTTQFFINYKDNAGLDKQDFSPFGIVSSGMNVVDSLFKGYEGSAGPDQGRIHEEGNDYLKRAFPSLDRIIKATVSE